MTAILAAILLEHFRPLPLSWTKWLTRPAQMLAHHLNAGTYQHGVLAWLVISVPIVTIVSLIFFSLQHLSAWLSWLWQIAVLYASVQFRTTRHATADIAQALSRNDLTLAQQTYAQQLSPAGTPSQAEGLIRATIEHTYTHTLHHLFGVLFWFIVLMPLGPVGALLYRLSLHLADTWQTEQLGLFAQFTQRMALFLNYLPARITALSFAIAGDFEDAVYCWRSQAADWGDLNTGVLLASAAGAMGIKLGGAITYPHGECWRPELGLGNPPDPADIHSAISLMWRALSIWLLLLLITALAKLAG
jgi:adenosylcobinamide-phosphate synthase